MNRTISYLIKLLLFRGGSGADEPHKASQKSIVKLTNAAVAAIREFQKNDSRPYVRIGVKTGDPTGFIYDLRLGNQLDHDKDFFDVSNGLTIVVERKSAPYLEGTTIDWQITDGGQEGFYFDNPHSIEE